MFKKETNSSFTLKYVERKVGIIFVVFLSSIFGGLAFPWIISNANHVFNVSDIEKRLPAEAKSKLALYNANRDALEEILKRVESRISQQLNSSQSESDLQSLVNLRQVLKTELSALNPQIVILPFFPSSINLLWPWMYFFLGILITVAKPATVGNPSRNQKRFWLFWLCILVTFNWPTWVRNFLIPNEHQVVYAEENWQISKVCFLRQELMVVVLALLVTQVWMQWMEALRQELRANSEDPKAIMRPSESLKLVDALTEWQVASFLLGLAFFCLTAHFYYLIFRLHDYRYVAQAISDHILWLATWIIMSLPLVTARNRWQRQKMNIIEELASAPTDQRRETQLKILQELEPFSFANITTSAIIAVCSFLAPLFHYFFS